MAEQPLLPLFNQDTSDIPHRFAGQIGGVWRRDWKRTTVGAVGTALFCWSAWPIATMP
jgi:hypothetical protein